MPGSPTGRIGEAPSPNPRVGVSCDNPLLVATMKKKARQQMLGPVSIDEGVELMFAAAEAHPSWEVLPHRGGIRRTRTDGPNTPEKLLAWFLEEPKH
jgi:hypothetical protein